MLLHYVVLRHCIEQQRGRYLSVFQIGCQWGAHDGTCLRVKIGTLVCTSIPLFNAALLDAARNQAANMWVAVLSKAWQLEAFCGAVVPICVKPTDDWMHGVGYEMSAGEMELLDCLRNFECQVVANFVVQRSVCVSFVVMTHCAISRHRRLLRTIICFTVLTIAALPGVRCISGPSRHIVALHDYCKGKWTLKRC